jgi:tetratricopeptide (TPR) repeat protein
VRADYEQAIELAPDNAEFHFALANFSMACPDVAYRDSKSFVLHAKWAVRLDPKNYGYRHHLSGAYANLGEREKAWAEMQESAELCPDPAIANSLRAAAHRMAGDFAGALEWEKKALELDPENPLIHEHLSWYYFELGQYEETIVAATKAIAGFSKIRSESSDNIAFYRRANRGSAYARLGMYEEALADLDKAVELGPFRSYTYKRRASVHFHLKNYDMALHDISKAVELKPDDLSNLTWLSPSQVARCPDERLREGLLELADKTVELTNHSPRALAVRDRLRAAFGRRHEPEEAPFEAVE